MGRYENPSCMRDDMVRSSRVGQNSTSMFDARGNFHHGHHSHHRGFGGGGSRSTGRSSRR